MKIRTRKGNKIFGWASVISKNGEPIKDFDGHTISAEELEAASFDYLKKYRKLKDSHEESNTAERGNLILLMPLTKEIKESSGISIKDDIEGLYVGYEVTDEKLLKEIKSGKKTEFSIGGRASEI